jgi:WD40 repeat protein
LISEILANTDQQHSVCFDPINKTSIATTGDETVIFWNWEEFNFEFYAAKVPRSEFSNLTGKFSSTVFLPGTKTAITATTDGFVVVWEPFHKRPDNADGADSVSMRSHMKSASKVNNCPSYPRI